VCRVWAGRRVAGGGRTCYCRFFWRFTCQRLVCRIPDRSHAPRCERAAQWSNRGVPLRDHSVVRTEQACAARIALQTHPPRAGRRYRPRISGRWSGDSATGCASHARRRASQRPLVTRRPIPHRPTRAPRLQSHRTTRAHSTTGPSPPRRPRRPAPPARPLPPAGANRHRCAQPSHTARQEPPTTTRPGTAITHRPWSQQLRPPP
jgi:hypothetical protein